MTSVLLIGESWFTLSVHQKGFDSFQTSEYVEGAQHVVKLLQDVGHDVTYVRAHEVERVPNTSDELSSLYDVVVISDVGANTFLLQRSTFTRSESLPNKLTAIRQFTDDGGGLLMVGGYMSFAGIDGKARYGDSPLHDVLPVNITPYDDRMETPEGATVQVVSDHAIVDGLPREWPDILGYNRVTPRERATTIATCNDDPLLVAGTFGSGRSAAFTSDLSPHWAPPSFIEWEHYGRLITQLVEWLGATSAATTNSAQMPS